MRIVGIIPARYESTRFPGKPLANINGKPMIWWVYNQCIKVKDFERVVIATDSDKIYEVCVAMKMDVVMTGDNLTGTDRVAEAAKYIEADLYVNIQGDEPLIEPSVIEAAIKPFYTNSEIEVTNLMAIIDNPIDVVNPTVPKVITNSNNIGVFLTRCPAPYPKGKLDYLYYKQVCVYAFKPSALQCFYEYGKKYGKGKIESIEDIEILRFIENGIQVNFIEVASKSIAVDTIKDLERVNKKIKERLV